MNDFQDPNEIHASAATAPDTGSFGNRYKWNGEPLRPYSLADKNAMDRVAWDNMTDAEYAQCLLFLLTQKTGAEASALRGDAAVARFHTEKDAWAEKQGAIKESIRAAMVKTCKEVLDDIKKADSVEPASKGLPLPNA